MESILEAINEWIKEILIGAINGNLYRRMGKQSDADCKRQGRPRRIYGGYREYGAGTGKDLSVSF